MNPGKIILLSVLGGALSVFSEGFIAALFTKFFSTGVPLIGVAVTSFIVTFLIVFITLLIYISTEK